MHCVAEGHDTADKPKPGSTAVGTGFPGDWGLNVTCCPALSTAVHCVADAHATPDKPIAPSLSTATGADHVKLV